MKRIFASAVLALIAAFSSSCAAIGPGVAGAVGVAVWPKFGDEHVEGEVKQSWVNGADLTVEFTDDSQYVFHQSANYRLQNGLTYRIYYDRKTRQIKNVERVGNRSSSAPPGASRRLLYFEMDK